MPTRQSAPHWFGLGKPLLPPRRAFRSGSKIAMPTPFWRSARCSTTKRVRGVEGSMTAVQFQPTAPSFTTEVLCTASNRGSLVCMVPIGGWRRADCFAKPSSMLAMPGAATCSSARTYRSWGTTSPASGRTSSTSCWPVIWPYRMLAKRRSACWPSSWPGSRDQCWCHRTRALKRSISFMRVSSAARILDSTATSSFRKPSVFMTCCACVRMKDRYFSVMCSCW
mmetsp:Transcript_33254/g.95249  ORF Transcript_33254/g.95249 Transcript_33254/m.95249 type:complete len:224 (-) Transcript_33254:250-921(-)